MTEYPHAMYVADATRALDAFRVEDWHDSGTVRCVRASAATGSNYEVAAAIHPNRNGENRWLVTVVNPWRNALDGLTVGWTWDMGYIASHLGDPHRATLHGGDLAAVTVCVNLVLHDYQIADLGEIVAAITDDVAAML